MPPMPLLLTEDDVKALLSMDHLIATMESALSDFSSGRVVQPLRTVIQVGPQKAFYGVMPAYIPRLPALGAKMALRSCAAVRELRATDSIKVSLCARQFSITSHRTCVLHAKRFLGQC